MPKRGKNMAFSKKIKKIVSKSAEKRFFRNFPLIYARNLLSLHSIYEIAQPC